MAQIMYTHPLATPNGTTRHIDTINRRHLLVFQQWLDGDLLSDAGIGPTVSAEYDRRRGSARHQLWQT